MHKHFSSNYRFVLVLVISMLLVSAHVVNAQSNRSNTNTNANTNTNTSNVNSPANDNTTGNVNSTTNTNQNTNETKTGNDQNAKPTVSPDVRAKLIESSWYPLMVSLLFGGLLIGFAATIIRVILRSKSSFSGPLGLPDGSLRAMLAFLLVSFLGFHVYASILSLSVFPLPESLLGIIATVIGFYFGSRSGDEKAAGATSGQTGSVDVTVVDSAGSPAGGATIELSQTGGKKLTQTADATGKFKFQNVPIGDYDIQASKSGSTPSDSAKVKVIAGGTQTVSLKLKP